MLENKLNILNLAFIFLSVVTFVIFPHGEYLILLVFVAFLLLLYGKDFLLILVIILFISFTTFAFDQLRIIGNLISVITLFYLFFRKFNLDITNYPKPTNEIYYFFTLLVFTLLFSTFFSSNIFESLINVLRTAIFFIICYLLFALIDNIKTIYIYIFGLIIAEALISFSVFFEFVQNGLSLQLSSGILARFAGIYSNPNVVGLTAFISTCFLLAFYFLERFSSRKYKIIFSLLLLNNALVFLLTDSRAAIIAVLISCSFILYVLNRNLFIKLFLSSIAIILILFLIPTVRDAIMVLLRLSDAGSRTNIWEAGLKILQNNFILGIGPGMYPQYAFTYLPSSQMFFLKKTGELYTGMPNPHNFILLMGCENGILGIITAISIFFLFFYLGFKCIQGFKRVNNDLYIISIAIFGIGIGTFERSFFEVSGIMYYGYITQDLPFWLSFIILMFLYKKLKQHIALN